ncbi:hypothetical protein CCY99_00230 [Helicobacter sp. 16-1353]|uniref:hypothetical protein n=1 Tax=Helicobacter sp. 16-1353 TaxID=2004996 RepID=UPI000DCDDB51|nr:hypothetical protein [Helicobacter sp. 16-1353]RAX55161.1 hypothetical protein CCY99_00230 [Helicobacter sp. 16-1353]
MDNRIKDFIAKNNLLSFSVIEENNGNYEIYCASCYYAFDVANLSLIIKSDIETKHIKLAMINPNIGIIIAKDSKNLGLLKGVQIKAIFKKAQKNQANLYYKSFPFATFGVGEIFSLDIVWAKYTDNKLLLSKKLIYTRE